MTDEYISMTVPAPTCSIPTRPAGGNPSPATNLHLQISLARIAMAKVMLSSGSIPGMAVRTMKSRASSVIPGRMTRNLR